MIALPSQATVENRGSATRTILGIEFPPGVTVVATELLRLLRQMGKIDDSEQLNFSFDLSGVVPLSADGEFEIDFSAGEETLQVALHTEDPGSMGATGELDGGSMGNADGYERATGTFTIDTDLSGANDDAVSFTASGGDWPSVTYVSLWTSDTIPVFLAALELEASRQINDGMTLRFAAGALTIVPEPA